ncbi:MAG: hypothetical protein Fur0022_04120 [Anaerolineales bacterium]
MYRYMIISITALIVLLVGATAISAASQSALPGDALYSVKTSLEDAQLSVTTNATEQAKLNMKFAEARLAEIQTLVDQQRYEELPLATENLATQLAQATQQVEEVAATDPETGAALSNELAALVAKHTNVLNTLLTAIPETIKPVVQTTLNELNNPTDDNNDDNGNDNDDNENDNDDNGNDNDDNGNDDNGNDNDDNGNENDDNGNDNDDNGNENDDNGNENDDNENDEDDNDDNDDNGDDNDDD